MRLMIDLFSGRDDKVIKHQQSASHRTGTGVGKWWKKNKLFLLVVVQWGGGSIIKQAVVGAASPGCRSQGGRPTSSNYARRRNEGAPRFRRHGLSMTFDFCSVGDRQMKLLNQDGHS